MRVCPFVGVWQETMVNLYRPIFHPKNTLLSAGVVGVSLNSNILQVATDYKFDRKPIGLQHTITKSPQ